MATSLSSTERLRFASTFLSHASDDKGLVVAVARQLVRRGVVTWLDQEELALGPLNGALKAAVEAQSTMTVFLSEKALASDWCKDELRWCLECAPGVDHVFPIYLGDALELVQRHELLRTRFLHPDGDRVNQLGYWNKRDPLHPDPEVIADRVAEAVFRRVVPKAWAEVAVIVDQRGDGPRRLPPAIPLNVASLEISALRFQVDLEPRSRRAVAVGEDWKQVVKCMSWGLSTALGTLRGEPRKVRVVGDAQMGLLWVVGRHFDRTTSAELYAYGRDGTPLTNKGQQRNIPLPEGDPAAAKPVHPVAPGTYAELAIGVGPSAPYAEKVRSRLADETPLFWLETGRIGDSAQAMGIVADLIAAARRLVLEHGARSLCVYWTSANHLACLAAAHLTTHVVAEVRIMEFDHLRSVYDYLPMH